MTTTAASVTAAIPRGGEWLLQPTSVCEIFTPERLTEEHRLIAKTTQEFVHNEVLPVLDKLEQKDWDLARKLIQRAGALGLLGVDAPDIYGGVGLDKVTSLVVGERIALSASFGAAYGVQTSLIVMSLHLFGNAAQKQKYIPRLLSGELIGAYALSEGGAGSDALGTRTRATRQTDNSFVLNGEKMWITNGGFADLFIVFAKVDDRAGGQFTAFLVERGFGVKSGKEEHKMGLHGSSTTALIFQDVKVPADNILGEVGKGRQVAFSVLSFARFKLGAMCEGRAQSAIGESARYAATRQQFGKPIATFGAIKHKIGEMVVRTYVAESLLYRIAGLLDARIAATPHAPTDGASVLGAFDEYTLEASIAKVVGSETLDFVLDENIQIHGANGFVRDYPAERHFRDARVNRIFEGTNEINRLLIPGTLLRRVFNGKLPLAAATKALRNRLSGPSPELSMDDTLLANEGRAIDAFKKVALMVLDVAMQTYGPRFAEEQEVLMYVSDILMDIFGAESATLRALAATIATNPRAALHVDAARVFVNDAALHIAGSSRQALAAMLEGDALQTKLAALRIVTKVRPINTVAPRRRLADAAVKQGGYPFAGLSLVLSE